MPTSLSVENLKAGGTNVRDLESQLILQSEKTRTLYKKTPEAQMKSSAKMFSTQNKGLFCNGFTFNSSRTSLNKGCAALILLIIISCSLTFATKEQANASKVVSTATTSSQASTTLTVTTPYDESIKWSFGGWAPLNGAKGSNATSSAKAPLKLSTPKPAGSRIASSNATQTIAQRPHKNGNDNRPTSESGRDSLSESASSSHEKVHFAMAPQQQQQRHQHTQQGPAYALPPVQRPMQFSPPAPSPIVRDHLLPAANHANYEHHNRPHPLEDQARMQQAAAHHHMLMQQHHHKQQHGFHMQQHPHFQHQNRAQQQHQHQIMQHQMMVMRQQHRPPHMRPMMMQPMMHQHQRAQHFRPMEQHQRPMPKYPSPQMLHQSHNQHEQVPSVGAYKVIEGEHPIMFTTSLTNERIPMIEMSAGNYTTKSEASANEQADGRPDAGSGYSGSMAAIEKDNLNYQNALNQVQSSADYNPQPDQQPPIGNNIQDIKQQQQQYEQQKLEAGKSSDKVSGSKSSYLTIPVAVETEGDKVLTADDINEIEKHVINVLPNLKTADKVVKLADAHLTLASIKGSYDQHQQQQLQQMQQQPAVDGPGMHQSQYEEHRTTMKQLENDLKQPPSAVDTDETHPSTPNEGSSTGTMNQATTAHAHHHAAESMPPQQDHEYYVAAGPLQEVGAVEPEHAAEYNLIKNDLLSNLRYEPTRASPSNGYRHGSSSSGGSSIGQQTASTPPMPYIASDRPPQRHSPNQASVTRYFQQGHSSVSGNSRHQNRGQNNGGLFARLNGPRNYQAMTSTTRTIMGGRKVSEVMRPLIHTTPVPMTSPLHVPSVEPEKVDAIQLIAGRANDKQPMVVEAHQLVNHTPDGGIDYNSGAPMMREQQQQQHNYSTNYEQQQQQQGQYVPQDQAGDGPGAIIEYVAISDQALNSALGHQEQQQPQSVGNTYEIASQVENQNGYENQPSQQATRANQQQDAATSKSPFLYDYTMSTQHQSNSAEPVEVTPSGNYMGGANNNQPLEHQPQLAIWSPSVANEHQQQQLELNEHAGQMQQIDMPATAGYNFFAQQAQPEQNQQKAHEPNHQEQPQYVIEQQPHNNQEQEARKWRTKAGGSQPNPDAQYDGQIAKAEGGQEQESAQHEEEPRHQADVQQQQQQYPIYGTNQPDLARTAAASSLRQAQESHEQQLQNEPGAGEQDNYQQQQQGQQVTTPASNLHPTEASYLSTNSYVGGAQMNHQTPSDGHNQQQLAQPVGHYSYMKLDRNRQQTHLAQHQAQHQAQLAEILNNNQQQQQQSYQTTTPISMTTLAAAIEQHEAEQRQQEQPQQQYENQQQQQQQSQANGYGGGGGGEDQESRPTVQSQPDSSAILMNENPMQASQILDQQSLIPDPNHSTNEEFSDDDGAKQHHNNQQPASIYQVYQAYYAPKDHKPLPGYVRLSLEEFNDLFRDAEIQYVDRNLNGLANSAQQSNNHQVTNQPTVGASQLQQQNYEQHISASGGGIDDNMKAAASENQSILVDRRSITSERRSSNSTSTNETTSELNSNQAKNKDKYRLGQTVKKIISIRNSRQLAKQAKTGRASLKKIASASNQAQAVATTTTLADTTNQRLNKTTSSTDHPVKPKKQQLTKKVDNLKNGGEKEKKLKQSKP